MYLVSTLWLIEFKKKKVYQYLSSDICCFFKNGKNSTNHTSTCVHQDAFILYFYPFALRHYSCSIGMCVFHVYAMCRCCVCRHMCVFVCICVCVCYSMLPWIPGSNTSPICLIVFPELCKTLKNHRGGSVKSVSLLRSLSI